MVGKSDSKENPKSDVDLDLGFVKRIKQFLTNLDQNFNFFQILSKGLSLLKSGVFSHFS